MSIRIAIIEDQIEIRESWCELIKSEPDFNLVAAFGDAEEAVSNLPHLRPDIVLVDIHLPGISGIEAISILKEELKDTGFLICTAFEDNESIFNALKAGATGYLVKTSSSNEVISAIKELQKGGSPMSSQIARKVVMSFNSQPIQNEEISKLSNREKEILMWLSKGLRYKEIADKLFLSTETVRTHIRNIYEKLQVNSRTDALNKVYGR